MLDYLMYLALARAGVVAGCAYCCGRGGEIRVLFETAPDTIGARAEQAPAAIMLEYCRRLRERPSCNG